MSRNFRNFVWFCLGFSLIALPMLVRAETIAATAGPTLRKAYCQDAAGTGAGPWVTGYDLAEPIATLYEAACGAAGLTWGYYYGNYKCVTNDYSHAVRACSNATYTSFTCPDGSWTLSGESCTRTDCAPGETRDASGVCKPSIQNCAQIVVTSTGSCLKTVPCTDAASVPAEAMAGAVPICSDQKTDPTNCAASGGIVIGTFQGKPICLSPPPSDPSCTALGGTVVGTLNGQPICSQANNPTCPGGGASVGTINGQPVCNGNCATGSAPGTVNGVTSCYPVSPTTTKSTTQKSSSSPSSTTTSSNDPNVTPGQDTKSSTTQCDGERCTTTTTTTKCPEGQQCTTTTSTKGEDKGDYCKENPKVSVCTGETEADKYCKDNPEAVSCMKAGTPTDESGLTTVEKGPQSITPVAIASSSGCPADVQLPKGAVMSYAPICTYAEGLRPLVLASAWLLAGLIVLAMGKGT